ncbi:hypothetical protein H696_02471 [Fonticula alba]|uniref:Oxidation resistance protein 1 n=1 Tax=Fonticula alba TaxID=691883 RepID=A0A058ZC63_FONAL|nr:hypothetical protein H696_02471 [Fonticula alba]KCV71536.1 hypothetical protein H696_02471 [Fonticula alba]|eukprot:XP_009494659.1 hypothetical protein H696_02471 [Fonticula alba]
MGNKQSVPLLANAVSHLSQPEATEAALWLKSSCKEDWSLDLADFRILVPMLGSITAHALFLVCCDYSAGAPAAFPIDGSTRVEGFQADRATFFGVANAIASITRGPVEIRHAALFRWLSHLDTLLQTTGAKKGAAPPTAPAQPRSTAPSPGSSLPAPAISEEVNIQSVRHWLHDVCSAAMRVLRVLDSRPYAPKEVTKGRHFPFDSQQADPKFVETLLQAPFMGFKNHKKFVLEEVATPDLPDTLSAEAFSDLLSRSERAVSIRHEYYVDGRAALSVNGHARGSIQAVVNSLLANVVFHYSRIKRIFFGFYKGKEPHKASVDTPWLDFKDMPKVSPTPAPVPAAVPPTSAVSRDKLSAAYLSQAAALDAAQTDARLKSAGMLLPFSEYQSNLLSDDLMWLLNQQLPQESQSAWRFLYSNRAYGLNWARLSDSITNQGPVLLILRDSHGATFGCFLNNDVLPNPAFTGCPDMTFLFTLKGDYLQIFRPTGLNKNILYFNTGVKSLPNGLGLGGLHGFYGLWIPSALGAACTSEGSPLNSTFGSPCLATQSPFEVIEIEAYGTTPLREDQAPPEPSVLDLHREDQLILEWGTGRKMHSKNFRKADEYRAQDD